MRFVIHEGSIIELLILKRGFFFSQQGGNVRVCVTLSSPKTRSVFSCPERNPDPFLFFVGNHDVSLVHTFSSRDLTMPYLTSGPQYEHLVEVLTFSGSGSLRLQETEGDKRREGRRKTQWGSRKTQKLAIFSATAWEIGYSHQAIEVIVSEAKRKRFFRAKSWSERPTVHHAGPCAGSEYANLLLSVSSFSRVFPLSLSLSRSF